MSEGSGYRGTWFVVGLLLGLALAGIVGSSLGLVAQVIFGVAAGFALYALAIAAGERLARSRQPEPESIVD